MYIAAGNVTVIEYRCDTQTFVFASDIYCLTLSHSRAPFPLSKPPVSEEWYEAHLSHFAFTAIFTPCLLSLCANRVSCVWFISRVPGTTFQDICMLYTFALSVIWICTSLNFTGFIYSYIKSYAWGIFPCHVILFKITCLCILVWAGLLLWIQNILELACVLIVANVLIIPIPWIQPIDLSVDNQITRRFSLLLSLTVKLSGWLNNFLPRIQLLNSLWPVANYMALPLAKDKIEFGRCALLWSDVVAPDESSCSQKARQWVKGCFPGILSFQTIWYMY